MPLSNDRNMIRRWATSSSGAAGLLWLAILASLLAGCAASGSLSVAINHYEQGRYRDALTAARPQMSSSSTAQRHEAGYISAISAYSLRDYRSAARYARIAAASHDRQLAGQASATLGMALTMQRQYHDAAEALSRAAGKLSGEDRALASFYAAMAYQKVGRWSHARQQLQKAARATKNTAFGKQIEREMTNAGWTLQAGAFSNRESARREAQRVTRLAGGLELGAARIVHAVSAKGQPLHLVQIGRFAEAQAAYRARTRLGLKDARAVALSR